MRETGALHTEFQCEGEVAETPHENAADANVNAEVGLASFAGESGLEFHVGMPCEAPLAF